MRVGIYCRISKDKYGKDRSLGMQEQDGIAYAIKNGFDYEVFVEQEGKSGTLSITQRPKLFDLLNKVKSKDIDIVYVYDLSRLERSTEDKIIIYNIIKSAKAKLYSERDGYMDFNSPENKLYSDMMSAINSYQVELTKAKVKGTLARNIEEGRVHSAPPFGYTTGENKKLIVNPETSSIVKRIFDLTIAGNGGTAIAKILTADRIPTPTTHVGGDMLTYRTTNLKEKVKVKKAELKWNPGTINRLVKNTIYKGERRWNDAIYRVEPIVSDEVFEKAQNQLQRNKNNSENNTRHDYTLKGKIICAHCGNNYHGYTQTKRGISSYQCYSRRIINKNIVCKNKRISKDLIEQLIWERVIGNPLFLRVLRLEFDFNNVEKNQIDITTKINALKSDITKIESRRKKAIGLCTENVISQEDLTLQLTEINGNKKDIETQLKKLQSQKDLHENQESIVDSVRQFQARLAQFENPDFATKRKLLDVFIDNVIVGYNSTDKLTEIEINLKLNEEYFFLNEKMSIDLTNLPLVTHQPRYR
jgi:site-specific DNA recombinase